MLDSNQEMRWINFIFSVNTISVIPIFTRSFVLVAQSLQIVERHGYYYLWTT